MRFRMLNFAGHTQDQLRVNRSVREQTFAAYSHNGPWRDWTDITTDYPLNTIWEHSDVEYIGGTDTCVDVTDSRKNDNPCTMVHETHNRDAQLATKTISTSETQYWYSGGYSYWKKITTWTTTYQWIPMVVTPGVTFTLPPGHIIDPTMMEPCVYQHANACKSTLTSSSFDLGLYVYELKDFKHLSKLIDMRHGSIFEKSRDAYFTWEFGLRPFLSDMNKLMKIGSTIERKLRKLPRKSAKVRVRTNTKLDLGDLIDNGLHHEYHGDEGATLLYRDQCIIDASTTELTSWAVSHVRVDYSALSPLQRFLAVTACEFGLTNPCKTIWNMIPFSFIADWFYSVGRALDKIDILPLLFPAQVVDSTYHAKVTCRATVRNELRHAAGDLILEKGGTGDCSFEAYERWVNPPCAVKGFLDPNLPDSRELLLSGLLLHQWAEGSVQEFARAEAMHERLLRRLGPAAVKLPRYDVDERI